jgi:hypothetical protein
VYQLTTLSTTGLSLDTLVDSKFQGIHDVVGYDYEHEAFRDDEYRSQDESQQPADEDTGSTLSPVSEPENKRRGHDEHPRRDAEPCSKSANQHPTKEEFLEHGD